MKRWDEARIARLEGALEEQRAENGALLERCARLDGRLEGLQTQIRRLEEEIDDVRRQGAGSPLFNGMDRARAAMLAAEAEVDDERKQQAEEELGFLARVDEVWGYGLSPEQMIQRGAMSGGREFPEADPAEEDPEA